MADNAALLPPEPAIESDSLEKIVDRLATQGWAVTPHFVSGDVTEGLERNIAELESCNRLQPAAVGRGAGKVIEPSIRGDRIFWLDESATSAAQQEYLARMERLRTLLNQSLFLGLNEFECHFAVYPPGAFYTRHIDQHANQDTRVVSAILYLNAEWMPQDAGELRIYSDDDDSYFDVPPVAGTLVTFLSDRFYHEVLPAGRTRHSITGWFRRRTLSPVVQ